MTACSRFTSALALAALALASVSPELRSAAAEPLPERRDVSTARALLEATVARPLRYQPEAMDFVIQNGPEFFNRPLYCLNSPFRVDGGDRPEFSLWLPGRGGNLRLGLRTDAGAKWLQDAQDILTRYRPGSMVYEIRDPLLGEAVLFLRVVPMTTAKGVVALVQATNLSRSVELLAAYGGAGGQKASRNGDIGCEREPVSRFFQLRPEQCKDNSFTLAENTFQLQSKPGVVSGILPKGARLALADANRWDKPKALFASASASPALPVLIARMNLVSNQPLYLALGLFDGPAGAPPAEGLPTLFAAAEQHRRTVAERVRIQTPDPFLNAAASAICVAADSIWDEKQEVFMHGAVAWRTRLLGWRGPYSGDALGWHDRTARHLSTFASHQNTNPVPATLPAADANVNLTRNEAALHSNGDLSQNHYDMNLVAIDALFRHLLWTGDLDYARKMWPVIERHLAWERRLFRRPFGPDALPLYEAYCCIWASDNMQYDGGGVTHSTAYNLFQNRMAARLAKLLGYDPAPYEQEADLIARAMRRELWLSDRGWFAECKDFLGLQLPHPNPGLWTFYHTIDSRAATPLEAWQMTRFVDTQIARIPIRGPGVPAGEFYTLPTTSWMPYAWSLNNVVMAEVAHTALAYWQADRPEPALAVFKGCLFDSMFQGLCPGNVGMCTAFDAVRGEGQRDFADAVGASSRALVEGLFGVRPDALAGDLLVRPGFPAQWDYAAMQHPDFNLNFSRDGLEDTWSLESHFPKPMAFRLQVVARLDHIAGVSVNGQPASWRLIPDSVGDPRIELRAPPGQLSLIVIRWKGQKPAVPTAPAVAAQGGLLQASFAPARLENVADPQRVLLNLTLSAKSFQARVSGLAGHRTVFAKLHQGNLSWWAPVGFETRPAFEILAAPSQTAGQIRFRLRNNTPQAVNGPVAFHNPASTTTQRLHLPALGQSPEISLAASGVLPGAIPVTARLPARTPAVHGLVVNWKLKADEQTNRFEPINLAPCFNDSVTRIFQNEYRSPRSPFCSLQTPIHGVGGWCDYNLQFNLDDSGLRAAARSNSNLFVLPQGIPLQTPGDNGARNVAFVSQWDNYPRELQVPLAGNASHAYLLLAGSSNPMLSRLDSGEILVAYADGSTERLALQNPANWWPIEQDYFIDDFAFRRPEPIPPRVDLKTGTVRVLELETFKGKGGRVPGGAATVLDLPLDSERELKSLTLRALANETVLGLMSLTLAR